MNNLFSKLWNTIEKIARCFLFIICSFIKRDITDELEYGFLQFIKFALVGVSNVVVSYSLYVAFLFIFNLLGVFSNCDYYIAQIVSFLLSVLWSFYWNNKKVFVQEDNKERNLLKALLKTYISYSFTGLFLNSFLLYLWVDVLSISEYIAPIISLLINVPLNFLINKFWAFK